MLRGILTVGLKFGPDGALYLADWITGWDSKNKGRIWKLDAPAAASSPMRTEVRTLIAAKFDTRSSADLTTLLRHVDMRIRQKAQFELVRRGDVQTLAAAALPGERGPGVTKPRRSQLARIHGVWGIAQLARTGKDGAKHAALLTPLLTDSDAEIRAQAAKMIGDLRYAPAAPKLVPLLADGAPRTRFFAAEALGRIAYKPAAAPIVAMLAANDDKDVYLRHAGSLALSRIGDAAALGALSSHPSRGVRIAAIVALRRLRSPEVARFVTDSDEAIVLEAARAINDDGSIEAALPALARLLGDKRAGGEPLVRRAISANLKVGSAEALARVATFAGSCGRAAGDARRGDGGDGRLGRSVADGSRGRHLSGPGQASRRRRGPGRGSSTHAICVRGRRAGDEDRPGRGGRASWRAGRRAGPPDTAAKRHLVQRACRGPQGAPGAQGAEHGRGHEDRRRRRRRQRQARRARHPAVAGA